MEKMTSDGPKWYPRRGFFPTNPDLADILGRTDLNFGILYFFGPHISGFPGPQISKLLDFQVPRSPNSQISRFPDFQTSRRRRPRRTLRSQPDPSPNAPRVQIRRKELRYEFIQNRSLGGQAENCFVLCHACAWVRQVKSGQIYVFRRCTFSLLA